MKTLIRCSSGCEFIDWLVVVCKVYVGASLHYYVLLLLLLFADCLSAPA